MALTQVKSDGIATGAVTATQIAANAVTVDDIANGSISTAKLADANVTTAKLADDAVTADKLADTAVTAGSYGSASAIPAITVDAQGRITAASTNAISVESDRIFEGNTSAEAVDTGSDGHFKVVTEGTEAIRVDSGRRLLVGTNTAYTSYGASASNKIQVAGNAYNNAAISAFVFGNTTAGSYLNLGLSRNTTIGSHTAVQDNNQIGAITFNGSDGTQFRDGANIIALVSGTPSTNNMPCDLLFATNGGSSSPTERMRITKDGYMRFGRSGYYHTIQAIGGNNEFRFTANAGQQNAEAVGRILFQTSSYGGAITNRMDLLHQGLFRVFTTAEQCARFSTTLTASTNTYLIDGRYSATGLGTGTLAFIIYTNGNIANVNNSYTGFSDVKLKENIVDATSQWDDIKAIRVRKYNFKEETGYPTHTQIGIVAQELELVSPGLVTESPDKETVEVPALDEHGDPVLDENGDPTFTTEERETGEVTKAVNYSVLYMKAVKALQEAMERIETLETTNASQAATIAALDARLTALEGA